MSGHTAYTMGPTGLTVLGNQFKEILLDKMVSEGHINETQQEEMNKYCFVVSEKGFFGRLWDKLYDNTEGDKKIITVVKVIGDD
jgi:hypothetical protein